MKDKDLKELISIMEASGISDQEATVYCACLEIGMRPVSIIAERAKIKRVHAYSILEQLEKRGLAYECVKNNVRNFGVVPLQSLVTLLDEREAFFERQKSHLKKLIPRLESINFSSLEKANLKFFRGEDALKLIFEETLEIKSDLIYGLFDMEGCEKHAWDGYQAFIDDYVVRRRKRKIMYHGIAKKCSKLDEYIDSNTNDMLVLKYLIGVSLPVEIFVYENKIAIISHPESSGLVIESAGIAATVKVCFELAWQSLPLYEPRQVAMKKRNAPS